MSSSCYPVLVPARTGQFMENEGTDRGPIVITASAVKTGEYFGLKDVFAEFDDILAPIVAEMEKQQAWTIGEPGRPPHEIRAMILAHLYCIMRGKISFRQLERDIKRSTELREALGFRRAPSDDSMHDFREKYGVTFAYELFTSSVNASKTLEIIDGKELIQDSAPFHACSNYWKAIDVSGIDEQKIAEFFNAFPSENVLDGIPLSKRSRFPASLILNFVLLELLGGYPSTAAAHRAVEKSAVLGPIFLHDGRIIGYERLNSRANELESFQILEKALPLVYETLGALYGIRPPSSDFEACARDLFGFFRKDDRPADADARTGKCEAKKLTFFGYRVQVVLCKKKISP